MTDYSMTIGGEAVAGAAYFDVRNPAPGTADGQLHVPGQPSGGLKWSGVGVEGGPWGLEEFTDLQVVHVQGG